MKFIPSLLVLLFSLLPGFLIPVANAALTVSDPLDRIIAVVNDDVITELELITEVSNIKKQLRQQNTRLPSDAILKKQILDRMILRQIQLQQAERARIRVDDEMLNRSIDNIATRNNLSLDGLRKALEKEGTNFAYFRENLRKEIIIDQLQKRRVHNRVSIAKQEIDRFLKNQALQGGVSSEYHIGHILIAIPEAASAEQISQARKKADNTIEKLHKGADFAQTAVSVSDGQQALEGGDLGWRRFEALPSLFSDWLKTQSIDNVSDAIRSPSGFHIIKLLGKRSSEQQHIVIQTHARHILISTGEFTSSDEARNILLKLRERLAAGEDFAKLAKAHSDDPGSAKEGGDLGWKNPGELVPAFEKAFEALALNQISEPVRTQFGWHIIEVLEKRNHDNTETIQRAKAQEIIRARKTEPALQNWLRRIRSAAFVENRL